MMMLTRCVSYPPTLTTTHPYVRPVLTHVLCRVLHGSRRLTRDCGGGDDVVTLDGWMDGHHGGVAGTIGGRAALFRLS